MKSQDKLHASVGPTACPNQPEDVRLVQAALNRHSFMTRQAQFDEDGIWDARMYIAIHRFQAEIGIGVKQRDGRVRPHTTTWNKLNALVTLRPAEVYPWRGSPQSGAISDFLFADAARTLFANAPAPTPADMRGQAFLNSMNQSVADLKNKTLRDGEAAIRAIAAQEGGKAGAFDSEGRPTILFERHHFRAYTDNVYTKDFPQISGPQYKFRKKGETPSNLDDYYPTNGNEGSYARLMVAYSLDPEAALKSASWGLFQQLGGEFDELNLAPTIEDFVSLMYMSVNDHFTVLIKRLQHKRAEREALVKKDWVAFAKSYNGDSAKDVYGHQIAEKYEIEKRKLELKDGVLNKVPMAGPIPMKTA